jgi:hypothetical protein
VQCRQDGELTGFRRYEPVCVRIGHSTLKRGEIMRATFKKLLALAVAGFAFSVILPDLGFASCGTRHFYNNSNMNWWLHLDRGIPARCLTVRMYRTAWCRPAALPRFITPTRSVVEMGSRWGAMPCRAQVASTLTRSVATSTTLIKIIRVMSPSMIPPPVT